MPRARLHTYVVNSVLTHQGIERNFEHLRSAQSASRAIDKTIIDLRGEGYSGNLSLRAEGENNPHDYAVRSVEI